MRMYAFCCIVISCVLAISCEVEQSFLTGETVQLRFSHDTLMFDTVFTARGSATRQIKVYNDRSEPIKIDRVFVEGRTGVSYSFNIDGISGPEAEDIVVFGNDSIFLFVEVEVDPSEPQENSPFIAEDLLIFELGNRQEEVTLIAFGQNAVYFGQDLDSRGRFFQFPCQAGSFTLTNELPYVLYGSWVVSNCTLTAEPGTRIYIHGGVQRNEQVGGNGFFNDGILFVEESGQVVFEGTEENPVVLSVDRLESEFRDDPAKYRGIVISAGSLGNRFEHTHIFNSIVGITIDSAAEVTLSNSIIAYSGGPAINGFDADISLYNSLFHSNFGNTIQIIRGGELIMDYVTIANYGVDASSLALTNFNCDSNNNCSFARLRARIRNSILSGNSANELILLDGFSGSDLTQYDVSIRNSIVRTDESFLSNQNGLFEDFYDRICIDCHNLQFDDPLFQSISMDNYQLDSLSVARNIALPISIAQDIIGNSRDSETPDAGAFERID